MSGMEPLVALGLACNVMQIIDFGHECYSISRQLKQDGGAYHGIAARSTSFSKVAQDIQQTLNVARTGSMTPAEQELWDISRRSVAAASKLQTELAKFSDQRSHLKSTLKALWNKNNVERLERELTGYQSILQTRLIASVSTTSEALAIQQGKHFDDIESKLRHFIAQYAQGKTQLSDLLHQSVKSTQKTVAEEGIRTRETLSKGLDGLAELTAHRDSYARLIESLRFPRMNERLNTIKEPHPETFEWIFDDDLNQQERYNTDRKWDSFKAWLVANSVSCPSPYWIGGKPGSGKSTLMRYIIQADHTRELLGSEGSKHSHILSFFFTVSGSYLQQSVRGMLCALLMQRLQQDEKQTHRLFQEFPSLVLKSSESDWSESEVFAVLRRAISLADGQVCIFIDGLDELCAKEDVDSLLGIVRQLARLENARLCVSSRLEKTFSDAFYDSPKLRIQDLTYDDIVNYVYDFLEPHEAEFERNCHCGTSQSGNKPFGQLIRSVPLTSDGVFLWVYLVVRQLKKGIVNGDTLDQLEERFQRLPPDLSKLYQKLWLRHGDDENLYRADAALCMNLVLDAQRLVMKEGSISGGIFLRRNNITLLEFTLALKPELCKFVNTTEASNVDDRIARECEAALSLINTRCIGLLESSSQISKGHDSTFNIYEALDALGSRFSSAVSFANITIDFIHRTAREFISKTEQGMRILEEDRTVVADRCFRLFTASLTCHQIIIFHSPISLEKVLNSLWLLKSILSEESQTHLLKKCCPLWQSYRNFWIKTGCFKDDFLDWAQCYDHSHRYQSIDLYESVGGRDELHFPFFFETGRHDFLGWASRYGFKHFVLATLDTLEADESVSIQYKSYLLQMAAEPWPNQDAARPVQDFGRNCDLLLNLLDRGADPSQTCLDNSGSDFVEGSMPIETFIYSLRNDTRRSSRRDPRPNYDGLDVRRVSEVLERFIEKSDLDKPVFSVIDIAKFFPVRLAKKPARWLKSQSMTLFIKASPRKLLYELYEPGNKEWINDLILGHVESDTAVLAKTCAAVILVSRCCPCRCERDENHSHFRSHGIFNYMASIPTDQECSEVNIGLQQIRQYQRDKNEFILGLNETLDSHLVQAAVKISRNVNKADFEDLEEFLVSRGLHQSIGGIETWINRFGIDERLERLLEDEGRGSK
ncbi:MAG: hypothetical protein M1820_009948 [Bogoriella megaspora]|nr:MAG: hypothetical protein M1820_009948 [Bogoriella megaspora]